MSGASADAQPPAGLAQPLTWRWWLLVFAGCLTVALLAYRQVLGMPLIGFDSYPLIAAARVQSLADLWGIFSEELMDGRYTDGRFYRPVTHASFALDYALHGLSPRGYHLTDLVLLAACATAVAAAGVRLLGSGFRAAALIAAGLVLLHPLVMEVVPAPPRRADVMALLFSAFLLASAPRPGERSRVVLPALLAAGAVGAKETGALSPLLLLALLLLEARRHGAPLGQAIARALPAGAGLAAVLAARTLVLGGLGGHGESGLPGAAALAGLAPDYAIRVLYPQPWLGSSPSLRYAVFAALALLLIGACLVARREREARTGLTMLGVWAAALLAISLLSGRLHDWYAFAFLAPYGLLLGCLVRQGVRQLRSGSWLSGALIAAPALVLLGSHLAVSHAVRPYRNILQAGRLAEQSYSGFDRLLDEGQPGRAFQFNPWVPMLPPHSDRSEVRGLFLFAPYSLQAYADLHADYPVRVTAYSGAAPVLDPDALSIELVPGTPPSWFELR